MPFDAGRIPASIIDAVKHRCLIPLVGAGMSKQSKFALHDNVKAICVFILRKSLDALRPCFWTSLILLVDIRTD